MWVWFKHIFRLCYPGFHLSMLIPHSYDCLYDQDGCHPVQNADSIPQYHFSAAKAFDYGQSMVLTVGEANERFLGLLEPMGTKPHLLHTKR